MIEVFNPLKRLSFCKSLKRLRFSILNKINDLGASRGGRDKPLKSLRNQILNEINGLRDSKKGSNLIIAHRLIRGQPPTRRRPKTPVISMGCDRECDTRARAVSEYGMPENLNLSRSYSDSELVT